MLPSFLSSSQSRKRGSNASTSAPSNKILRTTTNIAIPRLGNAERKMMGRPQAAKGGENIPMTKTEEGILTVVNAVERLVRDELASNAAACSNMLPQVEVKRKRRSGSDCYSDFIERALKAAPAPFLTEEEEVVHQREEEKKEHEEEVGDHHFHPVDSQQELMSPKRRKTGT